MQTKTQQTDFKAWRVNQVFSGPRAQWLVDQQQKRIELSGNDPNKFTSIGDETREGVTVALRETPVSPGADKTLGQFLNDPALRQKQFQAIVVTRTANIAQKGIQNMLTSIASTINTAAYLKAMDKEVFKTREIHQGKPITLERMIKESVKARLSNPQQERELNKIIFSALEHSYASRQVVSAHNLIDHTIETLLPVENEEALAKLLNEEVIPAAIEARDAGNFEKLWNASERALSLSQDRHERTPVVQWDDTTRTTYKLDSMAPVGYFDEAKGTTVALLHKLKLNDPKNEAFRLQEGELHQKIQEHINDRLGGREVEQYALIKALDRMVAQKLPSEHATAAQKAQARVAERQEKHPLAFQDPLLRQTALQMETIRGVAQELGLQRFELHEYAVTHLWTRVEKQAKEQQAPPPTVEKTSGQTPADTLTR